MIAVSLEMSDEPKKRHKDISPSIGRQTVGILEFTNLKLKSNYLL